jgi:GH25 family lysozyme M1 (1,4-beta-N-acetylmuramidase)
VDVSNHQGWIDWDQVRDAGYVFGFAKATEGTYYNDPYFPQNWGEMHRVGMHRGAYHFARPSSGSPDAEASFFLASINHVGGLEPGDMVVLDMEDEKYHTGGPYASAGAWSLGFLDYLEEVLGFPPLIYTGAWYTSSRGMSEEQGLADYPLWLSNYRATIPAPPEPWERISFWQHSDIGQVPGIQGNCDLNIFNGDASRIPLLGKPGHVIPKPPATTYNVGPGILVAMQENQDIPATNEHYLTPDWSEAYGESGSKYVYIASLNRVETFSPDA